MEKEKMVKATRENKEIGSSFKLIRMFVQTRALFSSFVWLMGYHHA